MMTIQNHEGTVSMSRSLYASPHACSDTRKQRFARGPALALPNVGRVAGPQELIARSARFVAEKDEKVTLPPVYPRNPATAPISPHRCGLRRKATGPLVCKHGLQRERSL